MYQNLNPFSGKAQTGGAAQGASVEFSRPADTVAYAAKDIVNNNTAGGASVIPSYRIVGLVYALAPGIGLYVTKVRLTTNKADCTARFRVHFYRKASGLTVPGDNAPFALQWSGRADYAGYIDMPALATEGTGSDCAQSLVADARLHTVLDPDLYDMCGILETLDAFTPASGQTFRLSVTVEVE